MHAIRAVVACLLRCAPSDLQYTSTQINVIIGTKRATCLLLLVAETCRRYQTGAGMQRLVEEIILPPRSFKRRYTIRIKSNLEDEGQRRGQLYIDTRDGLSAASFLKVQTLLHAGLEQVQKMLPRCRWKRLRQTRRDLAFRRVVKMVMQEISWVTEV